MKPFHVLVRDGTDGQDGRSGGPIVRQVDAMVINIPASKLRRIVRDLREA